MANCYRDAPAESQSLVGFELNRDVQYDRDGFAIFRGGLEFVVLHGVYSSLIECERGCTVPRIDCVCDGVNDVDILRVSLSVYDERHGHSPVDVLLSRNFAELRFGLVDNDRSFDATPDVIIA